MVGKHEYAKLSPVILPKLKFGTNNVSSSLHSRYTNEIVYCTFYFCTYDNYLIFITNGSTIVWC